MRSLGPTGPAITLAFIVALVGCGSESNQRVQTATVYSCDNPKVAPEGAAGCFPPGDPKHMTIALRSQPASGSVTRIDDPGSGVSVTVIDQREKLGTLWYEVQAGRRVGWIAEHLVVLDRNG